MFTICRHWFVIRQEAAVRLQAWFRGTRVRRWYLRFRHAVVLFQAAARGFLFRKLLREIKKQPTLPKHKPQVICFPSKNVNMF